MMFSFKLQIIWVLLLLISRLGLAATLPGGFSGSTVASELNPTAMTIAPDGRIFILEKDGRVLIVENDQLLPEPLIVLEVDYENERGLGGIVLDPDFATNNYFYLYYTVPGANHNRVSRFTASGNSVVAGSEVQILDLDELEGSVHNGGAMAFGPDGKLYIATGEGGKPANSQDLTNLLGKILRINKDGSIPADNPFYNTAAGKNRAIWALGLRNPFSFAIDPVTGTMLVNDVGQSGWEEVNKIVKGKNYGWPLLEGMNRKNKEEPANYQEPLYDYNHQTGCSIIGAAFYNPDTYAFPEEYHGKYFFGDYCQGFIKVLDPATGTVLETFATEVARPLAFLVSPDGSFYYLERGNSGGNTSASQGALVKVTYSGSLAPFVSVQPASQEITLGGNVTFTVKAGGEEPLTYQWYKNGTAVEGETAASVTIENVSMEDNGTEYHVVINNDHGTATSENAVLSITENTAPQVVIDVLNPNPYKAGETIKFSGYGVDGEDGNMPGSQLSWWVDFHHNDHTHPALELLEGTDIGEYVVPRVGETSDNVWYRIYLKATDSQGASTTVFREVHPVKSDFELKTEPAGLTVYLDGAPVTTPEVTTGVAGVTRELRAPLSQEVEGTLYLFNHWSDGSQEAEISFNTPEENSTWTAVYQEVQTGSGEGLQAAYYAYDKDNNELFSGEPVLLRIDEQISTEAIAEGLPEGDFNVRWTGLLEPMVSGLHTFYATAGGGVRLWVNNELIIDQWENSPVNGAMANVELEAGKKYPIRMEYFKGAGEVLVKLEWSSGSLERSLIPASQLYPLPYIYGQPSAKEVTEGAEASFTVKAEGKAPLSYQWFRNGTELEGETSAELTTGALSLEDDGAEYYVAVSNEYGTVHSEKAVISVKPNTAPLAAIEELSPDPFRAGETIMATGSASDEEDGEIPASGLTWWIELHKGEEAETVLEPQTGVATVEYEIVRTGETSDQIWYRVYLKATDSRGAETVVYEDIQPLKSEFEIQTEPAGLTVYLDGAPVTTPVVNTGVVGVTRELRAPLSQEVEGTLYLFDHWSDGSEGAEISFNTPEENSIWVAVYSEAEPGTGEGLLGAYYASEDTEDPFSGEPLVSRVDEQIDFDWGTEPAAEGLPADGFQIRWTGLLEPMVSGLHTFYVSADGGIRLWVNNELIIDQWENPPVNEAMAEVELEAGQTYQLQLEYYEGPEEASVKLEWSTERLERSVIPSSQLYPEEIVSGIFDKVKAKSKLIVYPIPADKVLNIRLKDAGHEKMPPQVSVLNSLGSEILRRQPVQVGNFHWQIDVSDLPTGIYFIRNNESAYSIKFLKK